MTIDELNAKIADHFEVVESIGEYDVSDLRHYSIGGTADEIWRIISEMRPTKLFWRSMIHKTPDNRLHCLFSIWPTGRDMSDPTWLPFLWTGPKTPPFKAIPQV